MHAHKQWHCYNLQLSLYITVYISFSISFSGLNATKLYIPRFAQTYALYGLKLINFVF